MKPHNNRKAERRHINFQDVKLSPRIFTIELVDEKVNVGTALFLQHEPSGEAVLWHIFIKPEFRRRGFASDLIKASQRVYNTIITDWESEGGHALCTKCGFVKRKGVEDLRLIWRKEAKDEKDEEDGKSDARV